MSLTGKEIALLKQRERLLEDVNIFRVTSVSVADGSVTAFDRAQDQLRSRQRKAVIDRLNSVEAELRRAGIETGATK